ncbi:MAG TPA: hypothetical protein VJT09_02205, partial [Pyrinomonadaceae bacterium]|nr:hypothetical protein [Pyrinomonadaceae bacterium]
FEQEWLCPKEAVTIYFFQAPSIEAAVKFYEELITSPVEAPGEHVDSPKIGDQSSITTHTDYSRSSYVYFRKGTIVVRIDSNILKLTTPIRTLENAIRFAQIVEEQIEPPGNSPKPTRL